MSIRHTAVDVGTPSNGFQEWEIIPVRFHGFEGLDSSRGTVVGSPEFMCCGHQWRLGIYPVGYTTSDDGMVGVYLRHKSEETIEVEYGFTVKKSDGRDIAVCDGRILKNQFGRGSSGRGISWGHPDFAKRSDILSNLVSGALVIEVRMRRTDSTTPATAPFIAENPCGENILKLFMDEESADVVLEVEDGDQQVRNTRKRTSTSLVKFYAHRVILKQCAPMLAELCGSGASSVQIPDVKPEIFRHVLYYIYGGEVQEEDLKSHTEEIIEAANRFGVVNLKLEAEASYVKSITLDIDNVMEHLLYADAMNCALLKEAAMDFILENMAEVIENGSLNDDPGGLLVDLLTAMMRRDSDGAVVDDFNVMGISDLRKELHERGLDIDGSREALIVPERVQLSQRGTHVRNNWNRKVRSKSLSRRVTANKTFYVDPFSILGD